MPLPAATTTNTTNTNNTTKLTLNQVRHSNNSGDNYQQHNRTLSMVSPKIGQSYRREDFTESQYESALFHLNSGQSSNHKDKQHNCLKKRLLSSKSSPNCDYHHFIGQTSTLKVLHLLKVTNLFSSSLNEIIQTHQSSNKMQTRRVHTNTDEELSEQLADLRFSSSAHSNRVRNGELI